MTNPNYNNLGANRYKLILSGQRFRNNPVELHCNGVTFPGMSTGIAEVVSPMRPIPQPGGTITFDDLYVNCIVSEDLREWIYIWNWIKEINFGSNDVMNPYYATGEVIFLTNKFNPLLSFTFHTLFPYILSPLDLTDDINSVDIITTNISFKFTDMTLNTNL